MVVVWKHRYFNSAGPLDYYFLGYAKGGLASRNWTQIIGHRSMYRNGNATVTSHCSFAVRTQLCIAKNIGHHQIQGH
jgi:hypothetical protein